MRNLANGRLSLADGFKNLANGRLSLSCGFKNPGDGHLPGPMEHKKPRWRG